MFLSPFAALRRASVFVAVAILVLTCLPVQDASAQLRTFTFTSGFSSMTNLAPGQRIIVIAKGKDGEDINFAAGHRNRWAVTPFGTGTPGTFGMVDDRLAQRTIYTAPENTGRVLFLTSRVHSGLQTVLGTDRFDQVGSLEIRIQRPPDTGPPVFASMQADTISHIYNPGTVVNLTLPEAIGGDGGQVYTLVHSSGPTLTDLELVFNGNEETRTLTGTVSDSAALVASEFTYRAEDRDADTTTADRADLTLRIQVDAVDDDRPTFRAATITPQIYRTDTAVSVTLPAAFEGNPPFTYAIAPTPALPAGLTFDDATRVLSGTPTTVQSTTEYTYTATDSDDTDPDSVSLPFTITIFGPTGFNALIAPQIYPVDSAVSVTLPTATGSGTVTYAITETLPAGLTFAAATRVLSGTPLVAQAGTQYTYTATDSASPPSTAELPFSITIPGRLIFAGGATIDPQLYFTNRPSVSITLPTAAGGTGPYTYTIAPALPAGLTFMDGPFAQVLSGQPTTDQDATDYTYTATDSSPASVSQTFSIAVARDTNPRFANTSFPASPPFDTFRRVGITRNKPFSLTLPAATGGNPPLRYSSASLSILPNNFRLDPVTRILTGTPVFGEARITDYRVTDADGDRATYSPPWRLAVQADTTPNLPAVPDQIYVRGLAFSVTLPAGTSTNGAISYSLTPALPANLTFDGRADRRTITGTAQEVTAAVDYTYTATDRDGSTRSRVFVVRHIAELTFGGERSGVVPEPAIITGDATVVTAVGTVTITDNPNTSPFGGTDFAPQTDTPGIYGSFSIDADGAWLYTLANTDPDTNALAAGDTGRDIFTVAAAASVHAATEITISVAGANDAPTAEISAPPAGTTAVAGEVITVTGSGADVDAGDVLTFEWTAADEDGNAAGSFADPAAASTTYTAPSVTGVVTLTLTVTDDAGSSSASATAMVDVTVIPVEFSGDVTGAVTEDDADMNTATGTLTVTNSGSGGTDVVAQTDAPGTYGTFTIVADTRVWTYTLDNEDADTDALHGRNGGEIQTDVFTVTAAAGGTQEVVITVTGANDAPAATITSPTDGMEVEFGALITLTPAGGDVDDGDLLFVRWTTDPPNLGSFATPVVSTVRTAAAARTTWTVPSDSTDPVTIIMSLTDGEGSGVTSSTRVTVNPIPAMVTFGGATTGALTVGGAFTSGTLTIDTAGGGNTDVVAIASTDPEGMGIYGTFNITAGNRIWGYSIDDNDPDTRALAAGGTADDVFTVTAAANPAATVDVVITVTGINDAPTAEISAPAADTEVPRGGTINLIGSTSSDPDTGQAATLTYAWDTTTGAGGSFADPADPDTTWTAPLDDSVASVTLRLEVSDGTLMDTTTVTVNLVDSTVTITGGLFTGEVADGGTLTAAGAVTLANSEPTGSNLFVVQDAADGDYGLFSVGADGAWTYTLGGNTDNDDAVNALPAGVEMDDTFTITAVDGGTPRDIVITVTGANDAPTALITPVPAEVDFGADVAIVGSATDPDTGTTFTYAWSTRPLNIGSFSETTTAGTTWTAPTSTDPVVLILTVTDDGSPPLSDTAVATITPVAVAVAVTFGGATTGGVFEDFVGGGITAAGTLTLTTTAANKNVIRQTARLGTYGRFTVRPNRSWTYTLDNDLPATNALARNMKVTDVFTVAAAANPAATVDVVITVTGANDGPVGILASPAPGTRVGFGGTLAFDGSASFDPDTGETETLTVSWGGDVGVFADRSALVTTWTAPASGTPGNIGFSLGLLDVHGGQFFITFNVELVNGTFTITGGQEGAVAEDGVQTATGTVLVTNDSNGNTPAFTAQELLGSYGRFSITTGGVWTYTLGGGAGNPGIDTAVNALAAGQMELERFDARSTVDALITIMVTGANDAPTVAISAPTDGMQVDFGTTVTLTATGEDLDAGATLTYAWTASPNVGSFANAAAEDTTWTAPTSGAAPVTLTLTVTDDTGATGTAEVTVNPTAVAVTFDGSDTTGAVTEDAADTAVGALTIMTASDNKNVIPQTDTPGTYGTFSVTAPGVWFYDLDNDLAATNALPAGDEQTETFTVVASVNDTVTVDVVIMVTGANDAPTARITAPADGMQVDFGSAVTLTATGEDPDTGQTATLTYLWTATPDVGSFANSAAASTTWTAPASGTAPVTLTLTVMDDATPRLSDTAAVTVNPVSVAITFPGGTTGGINEGDTSITRTLTVASSGSNTNVVAQTAVSGIYGTFAIDANGRWTYTLDNTNAAINPLAAGATLDDPFTVVAEANADATVVITITITGVNDPPTVEISEPARDRMQVDFGATVTLTGTGTDPDTGQTATLTYAWTANPNTGSFADATAASTTWTAPNSGTVPVTLTLTATDNASPPATGTAQVIVNPVTTAVTFGGATTGAVTEGDTTQITGTLTATTRDGATTVVARSSVSGTYGTFSIDADGDWSYTLDDDNANSALNALPAGDEQPDTFTVTANTATVDIVITVTGANDAPTAAITTPAPALSGTLSFVNGQRVNLVGSGEDVDTGNTLTYEWTANPATGSFADSAAAATTYHPPAITGDPVNFTLTLTVSDNFPSNPATGSADFALIVTEGPSVAGNGINDDPDTVDANTDPEMVTTAMINTDGAVTSGGKASGMLTVSNIPTNPATSQPFDVVHTISDQPTYGIVTIDDMTRQIGADIWNYQLDNSREVTRNFGPQSANAPAEDTFMVRTTIGPEITLDSEITVALTATVFPNDSPDIAVEGGLLLNVEEAEEMVSLDASGTRNPEGGQITEDGIQLGLTFLWADAGNDPVIEFDGGLGGGFPEVTFTAPDERTTLLFDITVTDDGTPQASATARVTVQVGRTSERALQKTLAAFGRAFAAGTVSVFEDYLTTPGSSPNTSHFTIGGHKFDMATTTPSAPVGTDRDLSVQTLPAQPDCRAQGCARGAENRKFSRAAQGGVGGLPPQTRASATTLMSGQDLLMQSAFHLNLNDATAASPGWSFWGRATTGNFNGDTESETADAGEAISVDGSVDSGYLGIDYLTPAGTRLGLAIAQSDGEIDYDEVTGGNTTPGDLEAEMTSILPYIQWQPGESTNAWLLLGYGRGDAEISIDGDADATDVDIDMQMLAFGLRGDLDRAFARTKLSWKASAFAITIESDDQPDLGGVEADSQRLRFAVEGRRPGAPTATGGVFTPGWELGMRWEDGDIERGPVADAGLRFDYTNPTSGWSLRGAATSVLFSPEDYDEWTAGLQARLDPGAQGRGITFTLEPGWTRDGRSQRMGIDFSNALGKWSKRGLRLELTGERTERDDDDIGHNIRLTGSLRF